MSEAGAAVEPRAAGPLASWSLAPADDGYPRQLTDLGERSGPRLYGVGRRALFCDLAADHVVTIVGSRRASSYGLRVAERLARELAQAGVVIVSGMAIGIDAAAHRGALAAGGTTVAVLAGGPDVVYPSRHRGLYRRIAEAGAVISERTPGTEPRKHLFRERNRIMAALAKVVIVVEAAERSGSLVTADRAIELGRELGAVPGQVGMRMAAGTNQRLKDGAQLVRDAQDVLDLLQGVGRTSVTRYGVPLDREAALALGALESGARTPDEVAGHGGLEARDAVVALARLELLGYATRDLLGEYAPSGLRAPDERDPAP